MLAQSYPGNSNHSLYGDWVIMYSSDEFGSLVVWLMDILNELAKGKPERELAVLEEHFLTTSRFEYLFWDMVFKGEDWPV